VVIAKAKPAAIIFLHNNILVELFVAHTMSPNPPSRSAGASVKPLQPAPAQTISDLEKAAPRHVRKVHGCRRRRTPVVEGYWMLRFGAMKLLTNARSFGRGSRCGITVQASAAVFIIQPIVLTSPEFS
jgi:hypothetical protein